MKRLSLPLTLRCDALSLADARPRQICQFRARRAAPIRAFGVAWPRTPWLRSWAHDETDLAGRGQHVRPRRRPDGAGRGEWTPSPVRVWTGLLVPATRTAALSLGDAEAEASPCGRCRQAGACASSERIAADLVFSERAPESGDLEGHVDPQAARSRVVRRHLVPVERPHLKLDVVGVAKNDQRSAVLLLDTGMRDAERVEMTCPCFQRLAVGTRNAR